MPRDLTLEKRIQDNPVLFERFNLLRTEFLKAVDDPEMLPQDYRNTMFAKGKPSESNVIVTIAELLAYIAVATEIRLDEAASEMMVTGDSEPEA